MPIYRVTLTSGDQRNVIAKNVDEVPNVLGVSKNQIFQIKLVGWSK